MRIDSTRQQGYTRCDFCDRDVPVDEGAFFCAECDPETGKCLRYMFMCDTCDGDHQQMLARQEKGQL